jgi:ADP-ribose pyrophosphatase YjhB (NUDIX family)
VGIDGKFLLAMRRSVELIPQATDVWPPLGYTHRMAIPQPSSPSGGPIVTVGALAVAPDGRFLVVRTHKWRDAWGVPGGKIDRGETMEEALAREFHEETGLEVRDVHFVAVFDAVDSEEFYKPSHMVLLNFVCACDGGEVTLSEEAQAWRWVSTDEALSLPLNTFTRRLIEVARAQGRVG